jgi:hypothetical protein
MAVTTVVKTIGTGGNFSTLQLWNDGAPTNLVTAERSNCGTFAVASFIQGESLTFVGSGATGKFLDTDSTGVGTGTYLTYGITAGDPLAADVITGGTSGATCVLTSGTADFVGIIWEGRCLRDEIVSATSPALNVTGSTSSVACYKFLTAASGVSFVDHPTKLANPLRYNAAAGAGIRSTAVGTSSTITAGEANFRISKLQVQANIALQTARAISFATTGQIAEQCIFEGSLTAASGANGTVLIGNAATPVLRNCAIIQRGVGADHLIGTQTGSPSFYNCALVAPFDAPLLTSIFLSGASGTITLQNCALFAANSTKAIAAGSASIVATTCVSDISGTAGVTQVPYGNEYIGLGKEATDLRLSIHSSQIDAGTTDAVNAPADIVGTARPNGAGYDIGPWESLYTAASNDGLDLRSRLRRMRTHGATKNR